MELRQLSTFLAVADNASFTRAAEQLSTTQSVVSTSVRKLERELGIALFERTTHWVALSDAGRALVPEARRVLAAVAGARVAVDDVRGGLRGTVRLGTLPPDVTQPVSTMVFVARFRAQHAQVRVEFRQAGSVIMAQEVLDGRLDFAIVGGPGPALAGLERTELARSPLLVTCAAEHRLAGRATVDLATVAVEPAADLPLGWSIRTVVDEAFAAAGMSRRLDYEVDHYANLVDLVRQGLAISILPASMIPAGDTSIVTVPLADVELLHRISVVSPTGRRLSRSAQVLRDLIIAGDPG